MVSVRLRSACSKISQVASNLVEKAEKQLLQDRFRCLNNTIEANGNTIKNRRLRLASLVPNTTDLDRCSKFINKVREERFHKIKDRQVSKFNILVSKNTDRRFFNNNNLMQVENREKVVNNNINSQSQDSNSNKLVINLFRSNLTESQRSVLVKEPNISVMPRHICSLDSITAMEFICSKLKEEKAMEPRADINSLLRKAEVPKPNLTKDEKIGLAQLKKDKDKIILTADKGVAMVVMNKEVYNTKAESFLSQPAYRVLPKDHTNQIKARLITKLRRIKKETNLDEGIYKGMYPTGCIPLKFYGLSKIHKRGNLLGPIVSSRGLITYVVSKSLVKC